MTGKRMTMPSPVDLRIWLLSRVLGWPGRRIASEVGVSQSTVVRTLEQLKEDPPTDQEMQDFVTVTSTPPNGVPALKASRHRYRDTRLLTLAAATAIIMIALAVTFVLVALALSILAR